MFLHIKLSLPCGYNVISKDDINFTNILKPQRNIRYILDIFRGIFLKENDYVFIEI